MSITESLIWNLEFRYEARIWPRCTWLTVGSNATTLHAAIIERNEIKQTNLSSTAAGRLPNAIAIVSAKNGAVFHFAEDSALQTNTAVTVQTVRFQKKAEQHQQRHRNQLIHTRLCPRKKSSVRTQRFGAQRKLLDRLLILSRVCVCVCVCMCVRVCLYICVRMCVYVCW